MNSVNLQGIKINIQKSVAFLFRNNKISEREIKKTIPFTIASKRIKYLEINLIKEVKELYTKNHKILMKKLKKTKINTKISHAHRLEELMLLKCSLYQKQSTDSMQSLPNFQCHFSQN